MNNKLLIGAAAGLLLNKTIESGTYDFWLKEGQKAAEKRVQAYNEAIKQGKTDEQAILIAEKADAIWRKLGSRRINGLATALLGGAAYLVNKPIGTGIAAAGIAKAIFPNKLLDLEFEQD